MLLATHLLKWFFKDNTKYTKNVQEYRANPTHRHCWWVCKMVDPPCKTVWQFLRKLNIYLSCNPLTPLLGIYSREMKTGSYRNLYVPNWQNLGITQILFRRWVVTQHIHTMEYPYNGILLLRKKKEWTIDVWVTWLYLRGIVQHERNQA